MCGPFLPRPRPLAFQTIWWHENAININPLPYVHRCRGCLDRYKGSVPKKTRKTKYANVLYTDHTFLPPNFTVVKASLVPRRIGTARVGQYKGAHTLWKPLRAAATVVFFTANPRAFLMMAWCGRQLTLMSSAHLLTIFLDCLLALYSHRSLARFYGFMISSLVL